MILAATALLLKERAKSAKNAPRTQNPEDTATGNVSGALVPVQSTHSSQSAQDAPFDMDNLRPGGETGVPVLEEPETDPHIIELFEMEKAGAQQAINEKSGFKNAIENLKSLKTSLTGKYAEEADSLIRDLEKGMKDKVDELMRERVANAAPLLEEEKFNEAVILYRTAMNFNASEPEFKDACREKIAEIVGKYMEQFDREARPMIAGREFDMAVNHYIGVRTGIRDNSLAQEFEAACDARIDEIRKFKDAVDTADRAKNNPLGFSLAVEQLNRFRSSPLCAGEALRLIGELEEAKKNTPASSEHAGEGDMPK